MELDRFSRSTTGLLALYLTGLGLFLAGFGSHYWTDTAYFHSGLWARCHRDIFFDTWECYRPGVATYDAWMAGVVSLMMLALIFAGFAIFIYVFVPFSAAFQITGALLTMIALLVYATYQINDGMLYLEHLGWSFWVTCAGAGVLLINGLVLAGMACGQGCNMAKIVPYDAEKGIDL